jgi:hypothetical protein
VPDNRILVQAARDFGLEMTPLRVIHNDDDNEDDFGMLYFTWKTNELVGMARNSCILRVVTRITT